MSTNNKFGFLKDDFSSEEKPPKDPENQQPQPQPPPKSKKSSTPGTSTSKTAKKATTSTQKVKKTPSSQKLESVSKFPTTEKPSKSEPKLPTAEKEEKKGKRSDPNYKTVGVLLPKHAHKKAKILLMDDEQGRNFSDLMTELLENWLEQPDC